MKKLRELISLCKCEVSITINQHKNSYTTAEQEMNEGICKEDFAEIDPEIREVMIEKDKIICIQFYTNTPVGFYVVYHHNIDLAMDEAIHIAKSNGGLL